MCPQSDLNLIFTNNFTIFFLKNKKSLIWAFRPYIRSTVYGKHDISEVQLIQIDVSVRAIQLLTSKIKSSVLNMNTKLHLVIL